MDATNGVPKGTRVIMNSLGLSEGQEGTLIWDTAKLGFWAWVKWDDDSLPNGDYPAAHLDLVPEPEPETIDATVALSILLDKTAEEAYARGKADAMSEAGALSPSHAIAFANYIKEQSNAIQRLTVALTADQNDF